MSLLSNLHFNLNVACCSGFASGAVQRPAALVMASSNDLHASPSVLLVDALWPVQVDLAWHQSELPQQPALVPGMLLAGFGTAECKNSAGS